jgi:pimeloyl-ACP methyl ester carboxylesterase
MRKLARALLGIVVAISLLLLSLARPDIEAAELARTYGGPTSRFASIDGMQVHYRDEGSGPPLVLIHGTSSSLHTWDGWVSRLGPGRRIIRLDLPGFGLTGPAPDRDYSAVRYARLVGELLDQLGVAQADVAGNSLGGRVALTLSLTRPALVRRLVLVDAAGLSGQRPPTIFQLARTPVVGRLLRWITPRFLVKKNVNEVYGDPSRVTGALVDRYDQLTRRAGNREALLDRLNGPLDPPLDDRLGELHLPVLLLWGDRDVWITPALGRRLHEGIAGSRLITYADAGHVPMEELPEATARDTQAFLAP